MTTTVEELEEQLSAIAADETVEIWLNPKSNFPGLTGAVQRSTRRSFKTHWNIEWPGEIRAPIQNDTSKQLLDFIKVVGNYHGLGVLYLYLPFKMGDLTKVAKALRLGGSCIEELRLDDSQYVPKKAGADDYSKDEAEKDVLSLLEEVSKWKLLKELHMAPRLCLDLAFLSNEVAVVLPKLEHLEGMKLHLQDPPNYNPMDTIYTEHLHGAFDQLQEGLDSNYSLKALSVLTGEDKELQAQVTTLGTEKFGFLLHLNQLGRKDITAMPFHLETWLEMLPMRMKDLSDVFYYLRKNTWMFTPAKDSAKEIKDLRDELQANRKRHRAEIEAKDSKIQRLLKALRAKEEEEEHKAELEAREKQHGADLGTKDVEIQHLTKVQHPCNQSGSDGSV